MSIFGWFLLWVCMTFGHTPKRIHMDLRGNVSERGFTNVIMYQWKLNVNEDGWKMRLCKRCHLIYWESLEESDDAIADSEVKK